ncbi:tetratricopeptide repeat protein [Spirosoma validum]|uniref:Helix-turn-helix transcriptional regulator n=1 Tax=Spirosoma validum TaxID=2771355 RepID=A0A927GGZ2_9BACT|nr:helix-turn-helix transcriptional regulator [Spirosoma validum]MBD2757391.1 helix-turn-helix transcriptional regulator [Spirosoma validum]
MLSASMHLRIANSFHWVFFAALWLTVVHSASADPFLQRVEREPPANRIRVVLNYFDTCSLVVKNQPAAFRLLDNLDAIGQRLGDEQLRRYGRMLRGTYAKNNPSLTDHQRAELFLNVAHQAEADDEQIAGVCEHFAGQYYYLSAEYGKAFQYLLAANNRFRQLGYANIPEIQRYLYELAFNYYYLNEDTKVIVLLTEAAKYSPFNPNLHIQTYNTLAMAQARQSGDIRSRVAERNYLKAYQLAASYRDSVWMGITYGNLGRLYANQRRWRAALDAYRVDYRLVMRSAPKRGYPTARMVSMAEAFYELGQLDSCRGYLAESLRMHQIHSPTADYSVSFQDDLFWHRFYDVSRRYYRRMGNIAEAYRNTDSMLMYRARIDKRHLSNAANQAEHRLLVQLHQAEMGVLEQRNLTQRLLLDMGAGVALVVAVLLGLLYRANLRRRQQEALTNAEREKRLELENQQVVADRDRARADLAQFIENLRQAEIQHELTETSLLTNDDWAEFRRRFERVYPSFFIQLRTQFTGISPAEERLLALSKLKIDTQQMSRMLGISPSSVRTTKYRLRKRLGINSQSPLSDLLVM